MQPQKALSTVSGGTLNDQTTKTTSCDKNKIRDLVHETSIDKTDLIYPMFIIDGETEDIPSIPNIKRYSLTDLPSALDEVVSAGVGAVLYFGIPKTKMNSAVRHTMNLALFNVQSALPKELYPDLIVIADICPLRVHFARSLRCYRTRLYRQRRKLYRF